MRLLVKHCEAVKREAAERAFNLSRHISLATRRRYRFELCLSADCILPCESAGGTLLKRVIQTGLMGSRMCSNAFIKCTSRDSFGIRAFRNSVPTEG